MATQIKALAGLKATIRSLTKNKAVILLLAAALGSRLPLLSTSLDEGDSAIFYNVLTYGYDITWLRPHAPGYPVYLFIGWLLDAAIGNPSLTLKLLSALFGSVAVIPFYLLLRDLTGPRIAVLGSLLFVCNPLTWVFSEVALSDVPSMLFVVLTAWLAYAGRRSNTAFLLACVLLSLAIGVRLQNVSLLVLLAFPMAYRFLALKEKPWRVLALGASLLLLVSLVWFIPTVIIGTGGLSKYIDTVSLQWSTTAEYSDFEHVQSPRLLNLPYRVVRFYLGYLVTYPWSGSDDKTFTNLLLTAPWFFGLALFVTGFRLRDPAHLFIALWLASLAPIALAIHFLPRYGLPYIPGFLIACLLGYRFLALDLLRLARRLEVLAVISIGTVLLMYGLKYQPPVRTFEFTPPDTEAYSILFLGLGVTALVVGRWLARRRPPQTASGLAAENVSRANVTVVLVVLALLVIPFAIKGYSIASIAHVSASPSQQLVEFVDTNFDSEQITPCWDLQTHFIFEALVVDGAPSRSRSADDLYSAWEEGDTLLVSEGCPWYPKIDSRLALTEIAQFNGSSPAWSKAPSIHLYVAPTSRQ